MIAALIASIAANVALAYLVTRELAASRLERGRLLQRIQAPERAIQEHAISQEAIHVPRAVSEFDDTDYWEAQGLSKDALAEMAMERELTVA